MVARAHRAELLRGEVVELALRAEARGADLVEDRVVGLHARAAPDAERDPVDDRVHDARHVGADLVRAQGALRAALFPQPRS